MSRRGAALALAAALAGAGAASGCGGDDAGERGAGAAPATAAVDDGLVWKGVADLFAPDELPRDKILTGTIRNDSGRPVELRVDRVEVKDATGRSLRANVRFVSSFGHGLYGPGGPPAPLRASRYDQARLGERLTLAPSSDRPITVAWRVPEGRPPATSIVVSGHTLKLP